MYNPIKTLRVLLDMWREWRDGVDERMVGAMEERDGRAERRHILMLERLKERLRTDRHKVRGIRAGLKEA